MRKEDIEFLKSKGLCPVIDDIINLIDPYNFKEIFDQELIKTYQEAWNELDDLINYTL